MTSRFVPLPDQVKALQIAQTQQARQLRVVEADAKRSAQQAEAAIDDVRTLSDLARRLERRLDQTDEKVARVNANVLVVAGQQGEQLAVMARMADVLEEIRPSVESARRKASGAHKLALSHESRLSAAEDRDREFAAAMAIAQAPMDVAERRALMADMYRAARPWAPKIVGAAALLILGVLALGLAAVHSCSPGGF